MIVYFISLSLSFFSHLLFRISAQLAKASFFCLREQKDKNSFFVFFFFILFSMPKDKNALMMMLMVWKNQSSFSSDCSGDIVIYL
jgi:hypothetical protein